MNYDKIVKEQMNNVIDSDKFTDLSEYASNLSKGISDKYKLEDILNSSLKGESIFDTQNIIDSLKELFLYEIKGAITIAIEILGICIIIGLLKGISSSFGKKSVSEIGLLTCSIVIAGLSINNFKEVYQLVIDTIEGTTYTMEILVPVLIAILISMGAVASGTIMSPLMLTAITIFQSIIKNIVLPGLFTSTILVLLNSLTEKDYVNKLSKFIRNACLAISGIVITLMSGIVTIQGLIGKTSDSLLVGTAKYSLDSFIPIVGGFASDTIELFLKCMSSIKGIVGIFGIIIIILVELTPIIKILAIAITYKICALLMEPIATKKLSDAMGEMGTALISMGAILFFSSLLFIIFITTIINLGGS